jgi:transcriptional regulator with XRE-family HTH domain
MYRQRSGLSLAALAERAGLGTTTLKALEGDRRQRPHPHTLLLLSQALRLSADEQASLRETAGRANPWLRDAARPARRRASSSSFRLVRLPPASGPLIGRESAVAQARALLEPTSGAPRLLTMMGPAGVGKTCLALAVAACLVDSYANGVVFVDLSRLDDPGLVPATIAHALDVRQPSGRAVRERLLDHLRDQEFLLVLDNFEHLLAATPVVSDPAAQHGATSPSWMASVVCSRDPSLALRVC